MNIVTVASCEIILSEMPLLITNQYKKVKQIDTPKLISRRLLNIQISICDFCCWYPLSPGITPGWNQHSWCKYCDGFWLLSQQVDTMCTAETFTGDFHCVFLDNFALHRHLTWSSLAGIKLFSLSTDFLFFIKEPTVCIAHTVPQMQMLFEETKLHSGR